MPLKLFDLKGRTAIVTGASRGIGFSAAEALAEAGANVMVSSRNRAALKEVAERIRALDREVLVLEVDISDRDQIQSAVAKTINAFGKINILVNNAGSIVRKPAVELKDEEWNQVIDVNLKGTFHFCQEVGKHMITRNGGGKIINVASLGSIIGLPDRVVYASSKSGVAGITRTLAAEWAKYPINVNAVGPGWIRTELTRPLYEDANRSANLLSRIPLGRWGSPEDLKGTFIYLASSASDYITGQIVWVDGGWTAV